MTQRHILHVIEIHTNADICWYTQNKNDDDDDDDNALHMMKKMMSDEKKANNDIMAI